MKNILMQLSDLADLLDKKGHYELANEVDEVIKKHSASKSDFTKLGGKIDVTIDIEAEEYNDLKDILNKLMESLVDGASLDITSSEESLPGEIPEGLSDESDQIDEDSEDSDELDFDEEEEE